MIEKKAYPVQLSYNISDNEKQQAERALIYFSHAAKALDKAYNDLNIMKTPFKDNPEITPEEIFKERVVVRNFRDNVLEAFKKFKEIAFKCVRIMNVFTSDTQSTKLIRSFIASVEALEGSVDDFIKLFDDLKSKDFVTNVVNVIQQIQKQCDEINEIIDERIKTHIQQNILSKNWVNVVGDNLQEKIEEKTPLIIDLYNKQQEELSQTLKRDK
jgi:hypothetical protein